MAQYIKSGNIFGRIGSGIGKGLAEQVPKEIEHARLRTGLQNLANEADQGNLSPAQFAARAAGTYGATPQITQTFGELARQQGYLNSLKNQYDNESTNKMQSQRTYMPSEQELKQPVKGEIPTLATPEATAQSYKEFIPPTEQEERADAFENFKNNPARYKYDYENALQERKAITSRNSQIQKSQQESEKTAVEKTDKIKTNLKNEIQKLGLKNIPPIPYQKIEEKIINSMLPKTEGGEGLSQDQAVNKYSKELNKINDDYLSLNSLSSWSPKDFNRRLNSLQKDFASRGEQKQLMDTLIGEYKISPTYAAHRSYPIEGEMPTLNRIKQTPVHTISGKPIRGKNVPSPNDNTYKKLKQEMGKKNSPLSIGYQLDQAGWDAKGWLKYLDNNRDDLEVWQADQLNKNSNTVDMKDAWLSIWE